MPQRHLNELPSSESMDLLASVPFGRVVFTKNALPAIRPVNHLVDGDTIIIRSHDGATIASTANTGDGVVVAYEADAIEPSAQVGWSVIVVGTAHLVTDPATTAHYKAKLHPWVWIDDMDHVIRIRPRVVTGYRLDP